MAKYEKITESDNAREIQFSSDGDVLSRVGFLGKSGVFSGLRVIAHSR